MSVLKIISSALHYFVHAEDYCRLNLLEPTYGRSCPKDALFMPWSHLSSTPSGPKSAAALIYEHGMIREDFSVVAISGSYPNTAYRSRGKATSDVIL
jgi:hypothetical protein